MNEKVKKFFNGILVFFAGIGSALLCVWGTILHHNRKRTDTTRTEQSESQGRSEAVEGRLDTVESRLDENDTIFEQIRKRKATDN